MGPPLSLFVNCFLEAQPPIRSWLWMQGSEVGDTEMGSTQSSQLFVEQMSDSCLKMNIFSLIYIHVPLPAAGQWPIFRLLGDIRKGAMR